MTKLLKGDWMRSTRRTALAIVLLVAGLMVSSSVYGQESTVTGFVVDANEGTAMPGANVRLFSSRVSVAVITSVDGSFVFDRVAPGIYGVEVSFIGFRPFLLSDIKVVPDSPTTLNVRLRSRALSLEEMIVTPGRFSILSDAPSAPQTLTRKEFEAMPFVGQDIYRAVSRLPGVTASDFSARFTVRGGDHDEILVSLDGLELYEPFHLKDLGGGVMSIVDVGLIQGVDLMTGGFPVEYGDKETAVLEMRTRTPREGALTRAEIGIMQATIRAEGASDRIEWMFSGRISHLDQAVQEFGPDGNFKPDFYDAFAKVTFRLNPKHRLSVHGLMSADDLTATDTTFDDFVSRYASGYAWATWHADYGATHVRTIAHADQLFHRRRGTERDNQQNVGAIADDWRNTHILGVKTDITVGGNDRHIPRLGVDLKWARTEYDFFRRIRLAPEPGSNVVSFETESSLLSPDGIELGLYAGDKMRLSERVAVDAGIRFDRQSYTGDSRISPRAGIAFTADEKTALRAAWGQYYQSQGIQELQVEDDESTFRRASLSTHYMAGIEHRFGRGTLVRVEGYYKDLAHIRDGFENVEDESDFLPEAEADRVHVVPESGRSQGLELFVRRDVGPVNWWFNYAFAKVVETHSSTDGYVGARGATLPRRFDQRHSFSIDLIFRPKDNWHLGMGWEVRGGWPYTPKLVETATGADGEVVSRAFVTGDFLSDRYPVYHRMDAKISHWYDYGRVQMRFSFGLTNVYNRENVRRYSYLGPGGAGGGFQPGGGGGGFVQSADAFSRISEGWLPALPFADLSLGF